MKIALFFIMLILFQSPAKSQCALPANIDIHRNVLTIAHYKPGNCGLINSAKRSRGIGDIKDLVEVMDHTGAYDLGSGFIYEYEGEKYVITCEHVIFKSDSIVGYDADYKAYELELVGGDTFYDLAILKFKNKADEAHWRGVRLDFTPQKNTQVYAAGYWKWNGEVSIGNGKLLDEDIDLTDRKLPIVKMGFVKSDALTDSGYSGGVLYNVEGQVIGMNNSVHAKDTTSYALQSKAIKRIIHHVLNRKKGKLQRAFLGIQFSQNMSGGAVMIDKIIDNTPAAKNGSQLKGKPVVSIDGKAVREIYDVLKIMEDTPPGKTITLEIKAENSNKDVPITTVLLDSTHCVAIALHAVRQHGDDECEDIQTNNKVITIITNKQNKETAKNIGLYNDRIYCLNDLAQLGTLVRMFSLHGELKIGTGKEENSSKGRWIRFSENDDKRVLYY